MEPLIFMLYYINVNGLSRAAAQQAMQQVIKYTKINLDNYKIIQQYFPVQHKETQVEIISVPNVTVENEQLARQINKNLSKLAGQFEQNLPIKNIEDLYG